MSRKVIITISVIVGVLVATGLAVLIWWLVRPAEPFQTIQLEGDGFGNVEQRAGITRIRGVGDMFWWFYPTTANSATRPIIMWLDGVTGLPPSLLANLGMFGPYDINLNRRENSWVEDYNLLFVDAPLGTGFSSLAADGVLPSLDENIDYLLYTLESFYSLHEEYEDAPLYIFGQGDGAQLAVSLVDRLSETTHIHHNLNGIVIGNGIISPALAMTKLGFYLEELGYIDDNGRYAIENLANDTVHLVNDGHLEEAFDSFVNLEYFVNENAGTIAVNLGHIVEKLMQGTTRNDYFGQRTYLRNRLGSETEMFRFMEDVIAPALGIEGVTYDEHRERAILGFREVYMNPLTYKVEEILEETNLKVIIYNGNLDGVSNTPGQLEWVENLAWSGQQNFLDSPRAPLVVNQYLEGYYRESTQLCFYWVNVAGLLAPLDNPVAMKAILQRFISF